MAIKQTNFLARFITGAIYVAILIGAILSNSPAVLAALFALFGALACYEWQVVTRTNHYFFILRILHALMGGLLVFIVYAAGQASVLPHRFWVLAFPYAAYYVFFAIGELYRNRENPLDDVGVSFFGHLYIALPLGLLLHLTAPYSYQSAVEMPVGIEKTFWLLPIFLFIWLNDTGAYLVGSLLGKHKLFESISPKKTIEGLVGGVVFAVIGAVVMYYLYPGITSFLYWMLLAVSIALFGTFGDLFESFVKRTYGVKDSGKILPGHGGILDRIDSLLFAAIPVFFFIRLLIYQG